MKLKLLAACGAALTLSACAAVTAGGPPVALAPDLVADARVDVITMSSDWLLAEDDFSDTFTDEVREELNACAAGQRPLNLRLHVDDLDRADRLATAARGHGEHYVAGLAEFVDPRSGVVVGRYRIEVWAQAGGAVRALLGDRQMIISETFGRELCRQAFGRNPRPHPLTRATPD